jgi:hypothetical protein
MAQIKIFILLVIVWAMSRLNIPQSAKIGLAGVSAGLLIYGLFMDRRH